MTCVAAIKETTKQGVKITMGADSSVSSGCSQYPIKQACKIVELGDFLFGISGVMVIMHELKYNFILPVNEEKSVTAYMSKQLMPNLRDYFTEILSEDDGFDILIGYRGHLFMTDNGYCVVELIENYNAVGASTDICLGSLYATEGSDIPTNVRLELALEASLMYTNFVRKPFYYVEKEWK